MYVFCVLGSKFSRFRWRYLYRRVYLSVFLYATIHVSRITKRNSKLSLFAQSICSMQIDEKWTHRSKNFNIYLHCLWAKYMRAYSILNSSINERSNINFICNINILLLMSRFNITNRYHTNENSFCPPIHIGTPCSLLSCLRVQCLSTTYSHHHKPSSDHGAWRWLWVG